ncbi:hypothetical protein [Streptomyces sp. NPDC056468]
MTDAGLDEDAAATLDRELTLRQQALDSAAKARAKNRPKRPANGTPAGN